MESKSNRPDSFITRLIVLDEADSYVSIKILAHGEFPSETILKILLLSRSYNEGGQPERAEEL